jgi:hypothetical protein
MLPNHRRDALVKLGGEVVALGAGGVRARRHEALDVAQVRVVRRRGLHDPAAEERGEGEHDTARGAGEQGRAPGSRAL